MPAQSLLRRPGPRPRHRPGRVAVLVAFAAAAPLGAQEYHVDRDAPRRVVFISATTLDEFEGVTERIDGYVLLDGEGVRPTSDPGIGELYFEVDLASIDTGIGLRNRHMRENYLEVESHPYATLRATIDRIVPGEGGAVRVSATGDFSVHGVTRQRTVECSADPSGDGFDVNCAFPVLLAQHDIDIPRIMFMKLAPEVRLELSFRLLPAG